MMNKDIRNDNMDFVSKEILRISDNRVFLEGLAKNIRRNQMYGSLSNTVANKIEQCMRDI